MDLFNLLIRIDFCLIVNCFFLIDFVVNILYTKFNLEDKNNDEINKEN